MKENFFKNEILPLVTTGMDLEGIMQSEKVSQRETNIIRFHLYVESKEQNKQTHKTRNKPGDTENKLKFAKGEGVGGLGVKGEGLNSTNGQLRSSHRDVKYSTGNTVNNIVITVHGARWVLNL